MAMPTPEMNSRRLMMLAQNDPEIYQIEERRGRDYHPKPRSVNGMVRPCSCPASDKLARAPRQGARHVSDTNTAIAVIGIDIGKTRSTSWPRCARAIVLRQSGRVAKWKRGSPIYRLA